MPNAIVIGGGPGGAIAGVVLARAGWDVTIVEQHRFPRDKVCGECVSGMGLDVLGRLGLRERLERCGPAVLRRVEFHGPGLERLSIPLSREMWGLSRAVMDAELLSAAAEAGAKVLQPARCEAIEAGSPVRVRVRQLAENETVWMTAGVVIVADGKPPAAVRSSRGAGAGRLGIKTHIELDDGPMDRVMLFGVNGNYGGLAAVDGGRWNVSFSIGAAMARECRGNMDEVMRRLTEQNAGLAKRWSAGRRVSEWMAGPLHRYGISEAWEANVIPVGNAAAAIEPVGGEGMGLAMATAELAANALVKYGAGLKDENVRRLRREMRELSVWRGRFCRGIAMLLSRPGVAEMVVGAAAANPGLAEAAMRVVKGRGRADII